MGRSYRSDEFSVWGAGQKRWLTSSGNVGQPNRPGRRGLARLPWPMVQSGREKPRRDSCSCFLPGPHSRRRRRTRNAWTSPGTSGRSWSGPAGSATARKSRKAACGSTCGPRHSAPGIPESGRSRPARPTRASSSGASRRTMPRSGCRRNPTRSAATRPGSCGPGSTRVPTGRRPRRRPRRSASDGGHGRGSAALVLSAAGHVDPPEVRDADWCRTPIDRFVLAAPRGARHPPERAGPTGGTLIRRVYFDLLGLPPSPEEVEAFVADPAPDAYEKLVDRLLASPHYGERWGRHWLDVARYADSDGHGVRRRPADRLSLPRLRHPGPQRRPAVPRRSSAGRSPGTSTSPTTRGALAATGFLAAAPTEVLDVPMEEEKLRLRYNELDDMAVTTASAFLGLTLGCAGATTTSTTPSRPAITTGCNAPSPPPSASEVLLATRAEAARYREQESRWKERLKAAQDALNDWLAEQKKPHAAALRTRRSTPWRSATRTRRS